MKDILRRWRKQFQHYLGCEPYIREDGEVINGLWWGFCAYCGGRHARDVEDGQPVGPWKRR